MKPMTFSECFAWLSNRYGWRREVSPWTAVELWEEFVARCEQGYGESIYEFENDRSVRDLLDAVLGDPDVASFPESQQARRRVEQADRRFESLSRKDVVFAGAGRRWWQTRVPLRLDGELAADVGTVAEVVPRLPGPVSD